MMQGRASKRQAYLNELGSALTAVLSPLRIANVLRPTLLEFWMASSSVSLSYWEVLKAAIGNEEVFANPLFDGPDSLQFAARLRERMKVVKIAYPEICGITEECALLYYYYVRAAKPKVVVETGVADGVSSFAILSALEDNGCGRLVSFDISPQVGAMIPGMLRGRWDLQVLPQSHAIRELQLRLHSLPSADLFVHDSNHWYVHHKAELQMGYNHLRIGGVIMSDDVDSSYAFLDFCGKVGRKPIILVTVRKLLGVILK